MRRIQFAAVGIFCVIFFLSASVRAADNAAPLADRVPDDAMIYLGWCGSDAMANSPAFGQSHFKALLDSSSIREVVNDAIPRLMEKVAAKNDPEAAQTVRTLQLAVGTLWKYPCAMYFKVDLNGAGPMPRGAIFAHAGGAAAALQKQLDDLLAQAPVEPQLALRSFVDGDIVGVSVGFDDATAPLIGANAAGKPLSNSDAFKKSLADLGAVAQSPAIAMYIDMDVIVSTAEQLAAQNPQAAAMFPQIKEATGLGGLHHVIFACGFDGQDWADVGFIDAPSPRKALLAMAEATPVSDESLAMVPVSAVSMMAGSANINRNIDTLRNTFNDISPAIAGGFNMALGMAQIYTGVNLEKDLFATLGEQWVIYQDPQITGTGALGAVVVNKLADAAKATQTLDKLAATANKAISDATKRDNAEVEIAFRQLKSGDITVNYLAIPFVAPSWTIRDGYLYVAMYPQATLSAAKRGKPAKSIVDNEKFIALRNRLGVKQPTSLTFDDLPASAPQSYQSMLLVTRMIVGALDLGGARAPELVLPPFPEFMALLTPAGSATWVDDQGIHMRNLEPFPGSALVSGPGGGAVIAAPALMASVMLPALNRARETANRVKCASNLRQIGQATLLYSNDHKGTYPPDLGAMLEEDISPEVFLCPDSSHHVPTGWTKMSSEERADWINKNSDYVYLGNGMNNMTGSEIIVAHEKTNAHDRDGMNLLYGDGHVTFEMMPAAQKMIAEQGDRKK